MRVQNAPAGLPPIDVNNLDDRTVQARADVLFADVYDGTSLPERAISPFVGAAHAAVGGIMAGSAIGYYVLGPVGTLPASVAGAMLGAARGFAAGLVQALRPHAS